MTQEGNVIEIRYNGRCNYYFVILLIKLLNSIYMFPLNDAILNPNNTTLEEVCRILNPVSDRGQTIINERHFFLIGCKQSSRPKVYTNPSIADVAHKKQKIYVFKTAKIFSAKSQTSTNTMTFHLWKINRGHS